ncbi:FecR domain-containing protein [Candidatus Auribacterota bacterium]
MFKRSLLCVVFAFVLVGVVGLGNVYAADYAALSSVSGEVHVKKANTDEWKPVTTGMQLESGDSVQTIAGSAEVIYPDGSILKIKDHSITTMEDVQGQGGTVIRKIKLFVGDMWAKITPGTSTKTEFVTPSMVAAVKGTTVSLSVAPDGSVQILAEDGSLLATLGSDIATISFANGDAFEVSLGSDGSVTVKNLSGDNNIVVVSNNSNIAINSTDKVTIKPDGSNVKVLEGDVDVTSPDGTTENVTSGNEANIAGDGTMTTGTIPPTETPPTQQDVNEQTDKDNPTGKDVNPSKQGDPNVDPNKDSSVSPANP